MSQHHRFQELKGSNAELCIILYLDPQGANISTLFAKEQYRLQSPDVNWISYVEYVMQSHCTFSSQKNVPQKALIITLRNSQVVCIIKLYVYATA